MKAAMDMKLELTTRLKQLHFNPRRCCSGYRQLRDQLYRNAEFTDAVRVAAALADQQRLAVVVLLQRYGELCACEIEAAFDLSHSTLAHHLKLLVNAGLVEVRKEGKWSRYRLANELPAKLRELCQFMRSKRGDLRCCCC